MLIGCDAVSVLKNNESYEDIVNQPDLSGIVISPGPGLPKDAGNLMSLLSDTVARLPTLGICLGHQALGIYHGARLVRSLEIFHGRPSLIYHNGHGVFEGIKNPFSAIRYHSWLLDKDSIPSSLEVTAWTSTGEVMGIQSKDFPSAFGIQFHPESALTEHGDILVRNFVSISTK